MAVSIRTSCPAELARPVNRKTLWFHVVCASVAVACLLQVVQMRFGRDQGIYAMVAAAVVDGGIPYRDAWDFKPPGIYLVYGIAQLIFGHNEWGIRFLEVLCLASLWPAFRVISRRLLDDERVGSLAAALAILMEAELEFWHTAQPETFAGVFSIWAIVLVLDGGRIGKVAGAGLLFGLAAIMKPHFGGGALIAAAYLGLKTRRETGSRTAVWAQGLTLVALTAAPALGVVAWFGAHGALPELVETLFVFAPGYVSTTFRGYEAPSLIYDAVVGSVAGFSALVPVGMLLGILGSPNRPPNARRGLALVGAMAIPQLIGIALQAKFFPYHYAGMLPLCSLLAAPGLVAAWEQSSLRWGASGNFCAAGVAGLLLCAASATHDLPDSFLTRSYDRTRSLVLDGVEERERLADRLYSVADVSYGANREVARWLAGHTSHNEHVYLWGFEPFVYFAAGRPPGSRFIYNVPQRCAWSEGWARPALMRDLEETAPKIIGVLRHDVFPMVTGDVLDSRSSLQGFSELQGLLSSRYRLAATVQDFDLYRLQDDSAREHTDEGSSR